MKIFVLALMILSASSSFAGEKQVKQLLCTSGLEIEAFKAELDFSDFDPASGSFAIDGASLQDNYATASLTCAGHSLSSLSCVGYLFNNPTFITEVKLLRKGGKYFAAHKVLKGHEIEMHNGPWPCTVK
jgi:hypothetical protein